MSDPDRLTIYTTAPSQYDGFSATEACSDAGRDDRGRVSLERRDLDWQTTRYGSGLHGWATEDEASRFPTIWRLSEPAKSTCSTPDSECDCID